MKARDVLVHQADHQARDTSEIPDVSGRIENIVKYTTAVDEFGSSGQLIRNRLVQIEDNIRAFEIAVIDRSKALDAQQTEESRVTDKILSGSHCI